MPKYTETHNVKVSTQLSNGKKVPAIKLAGQWLSNLLWNKGDELTVKASMDEITIKKRK